VIHRRSNRRVGRRFRLAVAGAGAVLAAMAAAPAAFAGPAWTTYHGDLARSGVDASEPSLNPIRPAWSNGLDGQAVYGQPVVADGRVFVATEGDDVYALDARRGLILWSHTVGVPLSHVAANVGCGDIDPLGVTSTPAVDISRNTVFFVAEVSTNGGLPVHHELVGYNVFTGQQTISANADPTLPPGENVKQLQQRAALAVANGRVYVAYGGLAGDCGTYHGWVVGVDESASRATVQFNTTPTSTGGAIWAGGGGPSVDRFGDVYVVTGNPNNGSYVAGSFGDAVVKLDPNLTFLASFHDPAASAGSDEDFGTGDALLLPNGDVFTAGKSHIGYLLNSSLGEIRAIPGVCGSDPDGGATYDAADNTVYVPCRGQGIQPVNLSSFTVGPMAGNAQGSPILVAGQLWAADYQGTLFEQISANGSVEQRPHTVHTMPTFATPSAADGLILLGTVSGIEAFDGPSGPPPAPPPPPVPTAGYRLIASDGGVFSFGTAAYFGSMGGHHLNAPIVGAARTPDGRGYWLVASDGGVFSFGDARFFGSTGGIRLSQPVVGMAAAPDGRGYWLVARDGGVFAFGSGAAFRGSTGGMHLNAPVVSMAADPATGGYWLFASDGGVFGFGAAFYGSAGSIRLKAPVVTGTAAPAGRGYWLAASDGGVFAFGPGAVFRGSTGSVTLVAPIVSMATDTSTGGYWLGAADGGVFAFGAPFEGSMGGQPLNRPVVTMTPA
jgi:hypothetical protein